MCFVVSMTGIKIIDNIAKIFKKDKPVAKDNIATFEISNEYLQIFNFLYLVDSSLYCDAISVK